MTRKDERFPAVTRQMEERREIVINKLQLRGNRLNEQHVRSRSDANCAIAFNILLGQVIDQNEQTRACLQARLIVVKQEQGWIDKLVPFTRRRKEERRIDEVLQGVEGDLEKARQLGAGKEELMVRLIKRSEKLRKGKARVNNLIEANRLGGPVRTSKGLKKHFGGR